MRTLLGTYNFLHTFFTVDTRMFALTILLLLDVVYLWRDTFEFREEYGVVLTL